MLHVYQIAMVLRSLENGGRLLVPDIVAFLLSVDRSWFENYENISKNTVDYLVMKHGVNCKIHDGHRVKELELESFGLLTADEVKALISMCQSKIHE